MGVFDAQLAFADDPGFRFATPPNGRLDFCLKLATPSDSIVLEVAAPAGYIDGAIYLEREAVNQGFVPLSLRAFTASRAASFFTERGLVFDPNAAQVVVQLTADRGDLQLDRTHGATQAGDDDGNGVITWSAGASGRYVLFPNVDATQPTATLTDPQRTHVIPIAPGELTLAAVSFVFL